MCASRPDWNFKMLGPLYEVSSWLRRAAVTSALHDNMWNSIIYGIFCIFSTHKKRVGLSGLFESSVVKKWPSALCLNKRLYGSLLMKLGIAWLIQPTRIQCRGQHILSKEMQKCNQIWGREQCHSRRWHLTSLEFYPFEVRGRWRVNGISLTWRQIGGLTKLSFVSYGILGAY